MKTITPLVVCLLSIGTSYSQSPYAEGIDTILWIDDLELQTFTTDNLGNVYLIYENEIKKIAPYPQSQGLTISFSEPPLGRVASVDAFNPMRILVRYQPFNQLILLDNKLNKIQQAFQLEDIGLMDVQLASMTTQNRIWLYDQVLDQVMLYNPRLESIEFSTQNLTQLLGQENTPVYLQSDATGLYIYAPETGLMVFDVFGNFVKNVAVRNLKSVQVKDRKLIGLDGRNILISGLTVNFIRRIELPFKEPVKSIRVENQLMFLHFEGKGLLIALFPG
ncbi:hypothetical protein [Schleiferia thermophila]|jgi:hypothetical protein|uniref:Uncharacterized protein n=1 Tax=Schleiferia thermophila TaxID=884107 RepID=A0A369A416_9FLAO|nr:hypothetical protein [Schleiferia thermophila]KFD39356.1 hypothetical protein AT05_05155 [Schleiferia thermophila str. Yellowstone]RCX03148.1 hypothetical protein DES35_10326 [Schleiferia thermophila]GCD80277.1 hypothetical protein JCM30197_15240 [Schleiferia thermophila]